MLTPEKSIQLQLSYDTDIAICLDECTHVDAPTRTRRLGAPHDGLGAALPAEFDAPDG